MFTLYVTETCSGCVVVKNRLVGTPQARNVTIKYADKSNVVRSELFRYNRSVPTMVGPDGRVYKNPTEILRALGL